MVQSNRYMENDSAYTRKRLVFACKRIADILFSLVGLLLAAPLFFAVAFGIRLDSRGPIFFAQERVGQNEKTFKLYKFRSMYMDAEERKKIR